MTKDDHHHIIGPCWCCGRTLTTRQFFTLDIQERLGNSQRLGNQLAVTLCIECKQAVGRFLDTVTMRALASFLAEHADALADDRWASLRLLAAQVQRI